MTATTPAMEFLGLPSEYLWVGGGAVLTCGLGLALLYWIDQEWRSLDEQRQRGDAPGALPGNDHQHDRATDDPPPPD